MRYLAALLAIAGVFFALGAMIYVEAAPWISHDLFGTAVFLELASIAFSLLDRAEHD